MSNIFETFDKQAERRRRIQQTGPAEEQRGPYHGEFSYMAAGARAIEEDPRQAFQPELDRVVTDALIEVGKAKGKGD